MATGVRLARLSINVICLDALMPVAICSCPSVLCVFCLDALMPMSMYPCLCAQMTMGNWAFIMYYTQDGVNWWTWILHFCIVSGSAGGRHKRLGCWPHFWAGAPVKSRSLGASLGCCCIASWVSTLEGA